MAIIYTSNGPVSSGQDSGRSTKTASNYSSFGSSSPRNSGTSSGGGSSNSTTQYLYYDVDTGVTTIAPSETSYYSGGGKVFAVSSGGGGSTGAQNTVNSLLNPKNKSVVNQAVQNGNVLTINDGTITGQVKASAYYNPNEQRIYDPAADRIIATLLANNPGMTPQQIEAYTKGSGSIMPVETQYAAAYMAAKNPAKPMMDYEAAGMAKQSTFVPMASPDAAPYIPNDDTGVYRVLGDNGSGDKVYYKGQDITGQLIVPSMTEDLGRTKTWMADGSQLPSKTPQLSTKERLYAQAESHNIFKDVPFFGPAATTAQAGLEGISYKLMGGTEDVPTVENVAIGYGTGFVGGMALGAIAAPVIVSGTAGVIPAAATVFKIGTISTAFDVGFRITGEGISSVSEGRLPSLEKMDLGGAFKPERIASNILLGAGLAGPSQLLFLKAGAAGLPLAGQVALSSGAAGAAFGLGSEAISGKAEKDFLKAGGTGALLGAATGLGGMYLQSKGINFVFQEEAVYRNPEGGKPYYDIVGWKAGVEYTSPKGAGSKFIGLNPSLGLRNVQPGEVITPTGVLETQKYASQLEPAYRGEAKAYFSKDNTIGSDKLYSNIEAVMGNNANAFISKTGKAGLVVGGSTVEKAISDYASQPGARGLGTSDIDVVGYGTSRAVVHAYAKSMGSTETLKAAPLTYPGYPVTVEKYSIDAYGKTVDVSVINPTAVQPVPPTPLGGYMSSFSFSRTKTPGGEITSYSSQQQIASKFMTLGVMDGKVTTFEQGKSKYLADTSAIVRSATGKGLGNLALNEPATATTVAGQLSIASVGSSAPTPSPAASSSVTPFMRSLMGSSWKISPVSVVSQPSQPSQPSAPSQSSLPVMPSFGMSFMDGSPPSSPSTPSPTSTPPSDSSSSQSSSSSSSYSSISNVSLPAAPLGPLLLPFMPGMGGAGERTSGGGKSGAGARVRDMFSGLRRTEQKFSMKQPKQPKEKKVKGGFKSFI